MREKPMYLQVEEGLRNDILSGKYNKGDYIPAEAELCRQYGITRATVRKALSKLIGDGMIVSQKGKGYYVTLNKIRYSMWNFSGFTEYLSSRNLTAKSEILKNEVVQMDGEDYLCLKRARFIDGDPAAGALTIDTSYIRLESFEGIEAHDFSRDSLYRVFKEEYGVYPYEIEFIAKPIEGNKETSEHFKSEGNIFLKLEGTVYDESRNILEKVEVIYSELIDFRIVSTII
jgi:DNA-binding GntR family transcriptional regulator